MDGVLMAKYFKILCRKRNTKHKTLFQNSSENENNDKIEGANPSFITVTVHVINSVNRESNEPVPKTFRD